MPRVFLPLLALALFAGCDATGSDGSGDDLAVRYTVSGPASITFTGAGGTSQTAAGGPWEQALSVPDGTPLTLEATSTTGAPVTAAIYLDGTLANSRRGSSVRLDASASGSGRSEARVEGFVEAVGADRLTVLGLVFVVDGSTRVRDEDERTIALSAIPLGAYVEVRGTPAGDGTFRATRVEIDDESGDDDSDDSGVEVEIHGRIEALSATSVTVAGRVFVTDATTRYLDDDNNAIARGSFVVGEFVEAEGHERADGSILAKKIKRDDD